MKIATWNVNSLAVRLPQVIDWLKAQEALGADQAIDVLALQEVGNGLKYSALWEGYQTVLGLDQQLMGKGVALLVNPGLQVLRSFQYTDPWVQCVICHIQWGDFGFGGSGGVPSHHYSSS